MRKIIMFVTCLCVVLIMAVSGQRDGEPCVHRYSNITGTCRPVDQCQSAKNDYKQFTILPTFCSDSSLGSHVVCCTNGSSSLQDDIDRPIWGASNQQDRERVCERKCLEYTRRKIDYIPLIPNGEDAKQGEFPHMAALGWLDLTGKEFVFKCGGTLISHRYVLSAAHCSTDRELSTQPVITRLGVRNIDNRVKDRASHLDVPIRTLHLHPDYKPPAKYNDIMLLKLAINLTFNSDLRPACLWTKPDFPGYDKVVATGWGVIDVRTRVTSDILQKAELSLFDNQYCDSLLINNRNRHWNGLADSQMCAGDLEGGKDTCQGDSGSPIQLISEGNRFIYHIVGVTSFGKYCSQTGKPGVYTRVSSYLDWIESIVWPEK